jgi:hypothetical protein
MRFSTSIDYHDDNKPQNAQPCDEINKTNVTSTQNAHPCGSSDVPKLEGIDTTMLCTQLAKCDQNVTGTDS